MTLRFSYEKNFDTDPLYQAIKGALEPRGLALPGTVGRRDSPQKEIYVEFEGPADPTRDRLVTTVAASFGLRPV